MYLSHGEMGSVEGGSEVRKHFYMQRLLQIWKTFSQMVVDARACVNFRFEIDRFSLAKVLSD